MALRIKIIADDKASKSIVKLGKKVASVAKKFAKWGAVGVAAFSIVSIKWAAEFSKGLGEVTTLMDNLTENQIKNMGRELRSLAGDTGLVLNELTKAKYDIVSAGFADAAESALILNASAKLAVGGVTSAANAADILTTSINAYGLSAAHVTDISDILFQTVKLGKTTITELSSTLGRILPIARAAGVGLDVVGAAMATLSASGLDSFEASTALRGAIIALTAPTKEAKTAMDEAGVSIKRFENGTLDLVGTMKQFEGMSPDQIKKFIPDIRAGVAVTSLSASIDKLAENIDLMGERAGATGTAFSKMQQEFGNKLLQMKNHLKSFMIEVGDILIKKLDPIVTEVNEILSKIGQIGWDKIGQVFAGNWQVIIHFLTSSIERAWDIMMANLSIKWNAWLNTLPAATKVFTGATDAHIASEKEHWDKIIQDAKDQQGLHVQGFKLWMDALVTHAQDGNKKIITALTVPPPIPTGTPEGGTGDPVDYSKHIFESNRRVQSALEERLSLWINHFSRISNFASQLQDALTNIHQIQSQQIQDRMNREIQAVLASGATEETKEAKIANIKEKAFQQELRIARKLKFVKLAKAISDTASAVIESLPNLKKAALVGIIGATEVAAIAAQPYRFGGVVAGTTDTIPAMLSPREIVSTPEASDRFGNEIARFNQLAESGSFGGSGANAGDKIYINALDTQSFYEAVRNNPSKFAEAIQLIKTERFR